jgi:hypothetical protein
VKSLTADKKLFTLPEIHVLREYTPVDKQRQAYFAGAFFCARR